MSLIHEDGTGLSTAESYISVANADTRQSNLGMTNWATLSVAEKEQALRRATIYMEQAYRSRWQGVRLNSTQALSWPRYGVLVDDYSVDSDEVPAAVANACSDLALKAAAGDLNADLERAVIRQKIGPIEKEFSAHSPQSVRYPAIEMTLAPYLMGAGANVRLLRA